MRKFLLIVAVCLFCISCGVKDDEYSKYGTNPYTFIFIFLSERELLEVIRGLKYLETVFGAKMCFSINFWDQHFIEPSYKK